jgi:hypothetical protein
MKSVLLLLPAILLVHTANAQVGITPGISSATPWLYHTPSQMPPMLVRQFLALGNRLQQPGNERITLLGTLTTASGASGVQIVIQLGGKLNITGTNQAYKIVFDGTTASVSGSIPDSDDLLEAFVDDLPEALMLEAGNGTLPRLLGRRFTNPAGGFCDYYDVGTVGQDHQANESTDQTILFRFGNCTAE